MNIPAKLTIKDLRSFAQQNPAAAQAIEELLGVDAIQGELVLSKEQLSALPAHFVEQMIDPKATAAKRAEALTRLQRYWERERGLLNTQHNLDALTEGLRILNQGLTAASVDRAIIVLRDQGKLQWRDNKKPTPAPAAEPAPTVPTQANDAVRTQANPAAPAPVAPPEPRRLKNGELELPIDAEEWQMRRASRAQLSDLSARRKEGRKRQSSPGSINFGSAF